MDHVIALFSNVLIAAAAIIGSRDLPKKYQLALAGVLLLIGLLSTWRG